MAVAAVRHGCVQWEVSTRGPALASDARATAAVHAALTHLAQARREARRPLPIIPMATIDGAGVFEAHLAAPLGPAPAPWRADRHVWSVDSVDLPVAPSTPQAWPAVVDLGRAAGRWLLADLAAAPGPVEVTGSPRAVRGLIRRLAGQLVTAPWSQGVQVRIVGAGDPRDPRVRSVGSIAETLPPPLPDLGGITGRWGTPPRDRHEVVLTSRPLTPEEHRLVRAAARHRAAPTVIAPGSGHGAWTWRLGAGSLAW